MPITTPILYLHFIYLLKKNRCDFFRKKNNERKSRISFFNSICLQNNFETQSFERERETKR